MLIFADDGGRGGLENADSTDKNAFKRAFFKSILNLSENIGNFGHI